MEKYRIKSLDGLRGIAAFIVVINHFFCTFYPQLVFGDQGALGYGWQDALSRSPFYVLWNGSFAVFVFFVLSGFVIASSANSSRVPLPLLIGRRYLRLTLPALASTLMVFVLLRVFPDVTQQLAKDFNNGWLIKHYSRELTLFYAMIDGVFNPYRYGETYANSPLWTMRYELFGSLSIYLIYRLCPRTWQVPLLVILVICLIPQDGFWVGFMGFASGAMLYEGWRSGVVQATRPRLGIVLCAIALGLGAMPQQPASNTYFASLALWVGNFSSEQEFIYGLGASILLAGCLSSSAILSVLAFSPFRFLGRISFGVYLLHWPLLALVFIPIYYKIAPLQNNRALLAIIYFVSVIIVGYIFTKLIDEPVIKNLEKVKKTERWRSAHFFYICHALVLATFLAFIFSRLGWDPGAFLVWVIAYFGVVVLIMRIYDWLRPYPPSSLVAS